MLRWFNPRSSSRRATDYQQHPAGRRIPHQEVLRWQKEKYDYDTLPHTLLMAAGVVGLTIVSTAALYGVVALEPTGSADGRTAIEQAGVTGVISYDSSSKVYAALFGIGCPSFPGQSNELIMNVEMVVFNAPAAAMALQATIEINNDRTVCQTASDLSPAVADEVKAAVIDMAAQPDSVNFMPANVAQVTTDIDWAMKNGVVFETITG